MTIEKAIEALKEQRFSKEPHWYQMGESYRKTAFAGLLILTISIVGLCFGACVGMVLFAGLIVQPVLYTTGAWLDLKQNTYSKS